MRVHATTADSERGVAAVWTQTYSGRAIDLVAPTAESIDFAADIAPALARIVRFAGAAGDWTVADHCVVGANLINGAFVNRAAALAFLLHDAHEAYIGDIITPAARAIAAHADIEFAPETGGKKTGYAAGYHVSSGIKRLKWSLDRAIYEAAGVDWPLPSEISRLVKIWDARLLITERNHLMAPAPRPWGEMERLEPLKTVGKLRPVARSAEGRAEAWLKRLDAWAPQARRRAGV